MLAACGNGGADGSKEDSGQAGLVREYNNVFSKDLEILDYTFTQRATNGDHFTNFVDGLLENDNLGNLVPAMAEDWEVSEDGLTYTYHIRQGVQWIDSEGNEYGAEVTAQDWLTGLKHAVEKNLKRFIL